MGGEGVLKLKRRALYVLTVLEVDAIPGTMSAREADVGRGVTNQKAYPAETPRPRETVRSSQKRFLSFPVMGAMDMVVFWCRGGRQRRRRGQSRDEREETDARVRTEGTSQTCVNIEALLVDWSRTGRDWSTCTHPSTANGALLIVLTILLVVLTSLYAAQLSTLSTAAISTSPHRTFSHALLHTTPHFPSLH